MIVLDTDHCVAILRGKLDPRTRVTASETLAVTAVTVAELTHGAHRSSRAADNLMRVDALLAAVNVLSPEDRDVIVLRYALELNEAEMADALGVARGTVKSRLSRAKGRLRDAITRKGVLDV